MIWTVLLLGLLLWTPLASARMGMGGATGGSVGPGTGDVLVSGAPSAGQVALWADPTHIQGVSVLPVTAGGFGAVPGAGDQVFVSDSGTAGTWRPLPACDDTAGQHLNYDVTTNAWTCGTTGGGSPTFSVLQSGTNTTAAMVVGTGASLTPTGTGAILATALAADPGDCAAPLFARAITAAGTLGCAQVSFGDLVGLATDLQIPDLNTLETALPPNRCMQTDATGKLAVTAEACSAGVSTGDKGDITVSSAGAIWTIDNTVVTYAKMQNVSAPARLLGRVTAGVGPIEELTAAQVKAMLGVTFGDISGDMPYAGLTPATAGSLLLGRGSAGAGDWQEVTLGGNCAMTGTVLNCTGGNGPGITDGDKGDVTVSGTGTVWTIDPGTVTYAKLQPATAASRLLGRSSTGAGDWHEVTLGTNLSMSGATLNAAGITDGDKGDVTVSAAGTTWTIDNTVVTYAKMQNVSATARLLGRNTGGAGPIEELTAATVKAMLGISFGDITGTASDAHLPDLNTVGTGLLPNRCVETDGTGKLGVASGLCGTTGASTGISGATNHGLMVATGGTTGSSLGVASNGQLPIGASGADPVLAPLTGTPNQIAVTNGPGTITLSMPTNPTLPGTTTANLGNATNLPLSTGVSGDLLYSNLTPATTASRLLGRNSTSAGDWEEVTLGTNLSMSGTTLNAAGGAGVTDGDKGDITVSGAGASWTLDPNTVTYAKLQDVSAASRLLGRGSAAGGGAPQELTIGPNCTMTGTVFNCTGGVGGGDVSVSGTPAIDQLALWVNPTTITGTSTLSLNVTDFDVATAVRTRPNKVGTTPPATCQVGDTFYDSDAAVSQKLLACETAPSGWAPVGGAGVGSGDVAVSGTPTVNQLAIWTDATTITGTSAIALNVTEFDVATATRTRPNKTGTTPPATCAVGETFFDSDATAGANVFGCTAVNTWTPQGGGSGTISGGVAGRATVYTSATTVDDSTAITMDDTDVLTYSPKVIPIAASMTAGVHNVVACTSGAGTVVMTLPPTASTPAKRYALVKVDTGAGLCRVAPATGEQINWIVDGPQDAVRRGDTVIVTVIAAGQWYAELGLSAESLATLPQVRSFDVGAGGLDVSGGCTVSSPAVLLAGGPKVPSIACADADTDALEFSYNSAKGWNAGTLVLELSVFYSGTTHNAQTFALNISGQCASHGDVVAAYAITSGATAESTSNVQALVTASAVGNRILKGVTSPLTLAGSCAPGDTVFLHGLVDAAATSFSPMSDLRILGVKVTWTRTAGDS